jgi:hypothetical protein
MMKIKSVIIDQNWFSKNKINDEPIWDLDTFLHFSLKLNRNPYLYFILYCANWKKNNFYQSDSKLIDWTFVRMIKDVFNMSLKKKYLSQQQFSSPTRSLRFKVFATDTTLKSCKNKNNQLASFSRLVLNKSMPDVK